MLMLAETGAAAVQAAATTAGHNLVGTLFLLVGLELILGVDNILVIAIVTSQLRPEVRNRARVIGLSIALLGRALMLTGVVWLIGLDKPYFSVFGRGISLRDCILIAGGLFLIAKATREIHNVVELREDEGGHRQFASFGAALVQIVALDLVFSIDSVITAVGLTENLVIILVAVLISFLIVLAFAQRVGDFILRHPGLKVLALSFLITIGVTLCIEAFDAHVPKAYLYMPMAFSLAVQLLQLRLDENRKRKDAAAAPPAAPPASS